MFWYTAECLSSRPINRNSMRRGEPPPRVSYYGMLQCSAFFIMWSITWRSEFSIITAFLYYTPSRVILYFIKLFPPDLYYNCLSTPLWTFRSIWTQQRRGNIPWSGEGLPLKRLIFPRAYCLRILRTSFVERFLLFLRSTTLHSFIWF